ncbi:hypothetical protein ABMA32_20415 [Mesorhizobium sp. VNQ89]|uniref:pyroglutamyl-peptidase I family protein n=1 Tax=Mesorhizobium quangtriensis TaxID=3157709 RepID=UPI0032B854BF
MLGRSGSAAPIRPPRILVTGFSVFPGAPVNPTEALVFALRDAPPENGIEAFRAEVLAVEYAAVAERLSAIGREFRPDIAIHFGLASTCSRFRLERIARNSHANAREDQAGCLPVGAQVCAGPETFVSTLPLDLIASRLEEAGQPVEWSDDAGGYLCNTVFTLSVAHACEGFAPAMSGFIHVPLLQKNGAVGTLSLDALVAVAHVVIDACIEAWRERA